MFTPRMEWLFGTCSWSGCEGREHQAEGQVSLSTDSMQLRRGHPLTRGDPLDITFTPRPFGREEAAGAPAELSSSPITPRQRSVRDRLQLPSLTLYPVPPNCEPQDSDEERRRKLLQMYQEVALELHTGMYLTQLTADRDYSDIHCQLMEDLTTLKLDQSNGRIIEFPLTNVSKVYRIVKNDDKFYTPGTPVPPERGARSEQIIVVEFLRRKLAFVFKEVHTAQRFMICMELLIRRAQQKQALRALTPTFPPRQAQGHGHCPTPRSVYEAMSRPGPHERKTPTTSTASPVGPGSDRSL